jgi:DNA-binding SARP family transcriptional activator
VLEFRILGPLEVVRTDGPVRLGGPRQRATLAILLLHEGRVVPVERLADELYAGRPPVTAVTQVQRQVSDLRRALGSPSVIETRAPGYLLRLVGVEFDLARFERLAADAEQARAGGDARRAAELLREALGLWRGTALADLERETFARAAAARLEELRLACLEERIDVDLALGWHARLVGELEALVAEHPLRERLRAQRMLALYRSGRQAEALAAYRDARDVLVGAFGIDPSASLQQLQRAILAHDVSLDVAAASQHEPAARTPAVVVAGAAADALDALLAIAEPVARRRGGGVVAARIVPREDDVAAASAALTPLRTALGPHVRTAAFTSRDLAADLVGLAVGNDADVVLVAAPLQLDGPQLPPLLAELFDRSPAHVGVLAGPRPEPAQGIFVPFGGGQHEWAALEVAAAAARATGASLTLVGTKVDLRTRRRDASRLLADASLALQRVAGIDAAPVLVDADERALVEAVAGSGLVVAGVSPRWRHEGIGNWRRALVSGGRLPVLFVHRGPRPGMLAPRESRTRFSWTLAP